MTERPPDPGPRPEVVGLPVAYGLELFKNRARELGTIARYLADPAIRMVTVTGRRGIGKSAVAAKIMTMLEGGEWPARAAGPRPWALVNLSTRTSGISVQRIYFDCARMLGPDHETKLLNIWATNRSVRDKVGELLTAMGDRLVIVLLDNLEDELRDDGWVRDQELAVFFDCVFRARFTPRLLVTTQVPVRLAPELRRFAAEIELSEGLPPADAVTLVREFDRDGSLGIAGLSDQELLNAVVKVHGIPRALELLVGAVAEDTLTLPTLADVLNSFTLRGDVVDALAQDRYRRLDSPSRAVVSVLAVLGTPVTQHTVEWIVAGLQPDLDVAPVLSHLVRLRLLAVDRGTRRFVLHPLDADLAYGQMSPHGVMGRRALERRAADWYASIKPSRADWRTVDDVEPHRREFEHRLRADDVDGAAEVLGRISEWLVWHGSVLAAISMHLAVAGRVNDDHARMVHTCGFGHARLAAGPITEAADLFGTAVDLAERLGDRRTLQHALFGLGDSYRQLGRLEASVGPLARASELAREIGEDAREAHAILSLSLSHSYLGDGTAALAGADQLFVLARRHNDPLTLARHWNARMTALLVLGRWQETITAAESAVRAYRSSGIPEATGGARNAQGLAHLMLDRIPEALDALAEGLRLASEAENPRSEGICLTNLACAHWASGDHEQAARVADRAAAALRLAGAGELPTAEALASAARARASADLRKAAEQLTGSARTAVRNAEIIKPAWLLAQAQQLRSDDQVNQEQSAETVRYDGTATSATETPDDSTEPVR